MGNTWIDAFELWCWRRLLRVPWTARRSNQSVLKEINPEYSLEGLMTKLKLQYLWPPDVKSWLIWKDPDAGKDWRQEEKGTTDEMVGWHHRLNGHELGQALGAGDGQGGLVCCSPWGRKEQIRLSDWTALTEEDMMQAPAMRHTLAISPLGRRSESRSSAWGGGCPSPRYSSKLLLYHLSLLLPALEATVSPWFLVSKLPCPTLFCPLSLATYIKYPLPEISSMFFIFLTGSWQNILKIKRITNKI